MKIYSCDFETLNTPGCDETYCWLCGLVNIDFTEEYIIYSIKSFVNVLENIIENNSKLYFFNLKFDGSFLIDYLERNGFRKYIFERKKEDGSIERYWGEKSYMPSHTYFCFINNRGMWYHICIKFGKKIIHIYDTTKIFPGMDLASAAESLELEHRKGKMDYHTYHEENGSVSDLELEYFKNDLYVQADLLNLLLKKGVEEMTIGSHCLRVFKRMYGKINFYKDFPNLYEIYPEESYMPISVGDYLLNSYYGGYNWVNEEVKGKVIKNGWTLDVNSLYASVMHSKYGVEYPFGMPNYGKGKCSKKYGHYFFQRFRCKFRLKKGKIPFVRIRKGLIFNIRENLKSSLITNNMGEEEYLDVVLTYSMTELDLFLEHYEVWDFEYIDYMEFLGRSGIFDYYVDTFYNGKANAKNKGERAYNKMMLVNLYGKFCSKRDSSFKIPYINEKKDSISFMEEESYSNVPGYIAVGSAIVSEARCFSIRYCQIAYQNKKGGFCYSDTDSIHGWGEIPEQIPISDSRLLTYKLETRWDEGWFQSGKRYIEHIIEEGGKIVDPYYSVVASGLSKRGRDLMRISLGDLDPEELAPFTPLEEDFICEKREITDFDVGISIPGNLAMKRVKGGIVLEESEFSIL